MADDTYYSDRTDGPVARVREDVPAEVWRGLVALIQRRVDSGWLAREFPGQGCPDGSAITGTNRNAFDASLLAEIPRLQPFEGWSDKAQFMVDYRPLLDPAQLPPTPTALDVIDFITRHVAKPTNRVSHDYFRHDHLVFDETMDDPTSDECRSVREGRREFRKDVDLIFARNGLAFTIGDDNKVQRLGPVEARRMLGDFVPRTGDAELDAMLQDARARFTSRDRSDQAAALDKLWDAFERLKTLELGDPTKKTQPAQQLIQRAAAGSDTLAGHLHHEFRALTDIGNQFYIRLSEHGQHRLPEPAGVDYVFTRLLALTAFVLRQTNRM